MELILSKKIIADTDNVQAGLQVFLDKRPVRTPDKEILTLPTSKHQLATAIALEWDLLVSAQQALRTHYIPMTSLAARAVDIQTADAQGKPKIRNDIVNMFMRYFGGGIGHKTLQHIVNIKDTLAILNAAVIHERDAANSDDLSMFLLSSQLTSTQFNRS